MDIVWLVFRWLHIFPAVILLGGALLMRFTLWPSLATLTEEERRRVLDAIRRRWAMWVGISAGLLLLSGIVNTVLILQDYKVEGAYHGALGAKVLLALGIIYIASMLAGRSEAAERFQLRTPMWLNVNMVLTVLLICVAGWMRMADRTPKTDTVMNSATGAPTSAAPNTLGD